MFLLWATFVGILSLGGYYISNNLLAREYIVHNHGVILITGASTGIGSHAAITLAEKGYIVYAGVRKEKDMENIRNLGIKNLLPLQLDVSLHSSCVEAMNFITEETERLNLPFVALVNNAGVSRKLPVEFHDVDDAKKVFDTNYFGVLDMVQLALPQLRKSQGRIIMTSSITGFLGNTTFQWNFDSFRSSTN